MKRLILSLCLGLVSVPIPSLVLADCINAGSDCIPYDEPGIPTPTWAKAPPFGCVVGGQVVPVFSKCNPVNDLGCNASCADFELVGKVFVSPSGSLDTFEDVSDSFGLLPDGVTTQRWINQVQESCTELGQLHYRASVYTIASQAKSSK